MVEIRVEDERFTLAVLREALSYAQSRMGVDTNGRRAVFSIQVILNDIDRQLGEGRAR